MLNLARLLIDFIRLSVFGSFDLTIIDMIKYALLDAFDLDMWLYLIQSNTRMGPQYMCGVVEGQDLNEMHENGKMFNAQPHFKNWKDKMMSTQAMRIITKQLDDVLHSIIELLLSGPL